MITTRSLADFKADCAAQDMPREHIAVMCPVCGTIQSIASLIAAGVSPHAAEAAIGFSCEGRFTNAGPARHGQPARPGTRGCDWTLGGLFKMHRLEVITEDGERHPHFELATKTDAQELRVETLRRTRR
jgi:hypothetical protein